MKNKYEQVGPKALRIRERMLSGSKGSLLLCSDQHFDSEHCNRNMLRSHLQQAVDQGASIFFCGDWFDAMQGKRDPRGSKGATRKEYQRNDYLNALVEDTVSFLEPFSANIAGWASGNHETSILRFAEVDLISLCIDRLADKTKNKIIKMPYSGWVLYSSMMRESSEIPDATTKIAYTHGSGGGGAVTKGTIQTSRRAVYLPDADIVVSGHIHESWVMELRRERISTWGKDYQDTQWHIQLPTYKNEYTGDGWWAEKGLSPRPQGGVWLDFERVTRKGSKKKTNTYGVKISPRRLT